MFRSIRRFPQLVAAFAMVAMVAVAVPAASVAQDYRNPDSKAAAIEAQQQSSQDLRSPDARAGRVEQSPPPPLEIARATGFDWGDAGIGAGSVLGLLLITLSIIYGVVHRRSRKAEGSGGPALTA